MSKIKQATYMLQLNGQLEFSYYSKYKGAVFVLEKDKVLAGMGKVRSITLNEHSMSFLGQIKMGEEIKKNKKSI